ncbi:MAG: cellulase family glycosylhydrolase [Nitrososphaeraceae archaeon]|nr:cellulase family glycosylhydrolase [Nitrososphaeraceae archaeon]
MSSIHLNGRDLAKKGSWFIIENSDMDKSQIKDGRYVLFRGVNFGSRSKLSPYIPLTPLDKKAISISELKKEIASCSTQLDLLKESGFNIVRLLVLWKALEPEPNNDLDKLMPQGIEYLSLLKEIIKELYSRGIMILLDFHQDIAHEILGGDGFPDWALAIDKETTLPEIPVRDNRRWQTYYQLNKLVKKTLQSFYNNKLTNENAGLKDYPVRTHLEKTIGQTIKFFKSLKNEDEKCFSAIIGVDPFNEPHPVGLNKIKFESELLKEYYFNVNKEIRRYDDKIFLFIQPRVDWDVFSSEAIDEPDTIEKKLSKFDLRRFLKIGDMSLIKTPLDTNITQRSLMELPKNITTYLPKNLPSEITDRGVFSFHFYDTRSIMHAILKIPDNISSYKQEWPNLFKQLVQAAYDRDLIPFLTEFGGTHDSERVREYIDISYEQLESVLLNSTYWNYDLYNTKDKNDNWNLENFSILGPNRTPRHLDVISRPYPMLSSAKPSLLYFDNTSKYTAIIIEGKVVDEPTIIFIPDHIHYKSGFSVWATSDKIEWNEKEKLLSWFPKKEYNKNQIIITTAKKDGFELDEKNLPKPSRDADLLSKTEFITTFPRK